MQLIVLYVFQVLTEREREIKHLLLIIITILLLLI